MTNLRSTDPSIFFLTILNTKIKGSKGRLHIIAIYFLSSIILFKKCYTKKFIGTLCHLDTDS